MRVLILAAGVAALAMVGTAVAQAPTISGYLTPEQIPDGTKILEAPPKKGDGRWERDRAAFKATRKFEGNARWALANHDNKYDLVSLYGDFSCALGANLTPQTAPRLSGMIGRIGRDSSRTVNHAKDIFKDPRPYLTHGGKICIDRVKALDDSPNYPSGHAGYIWAIGLVLAEIAPDRATAILDRARAFGESRAVCGVHTVSAVETARTLASSMVAVQHASPDFRADLEAARAEVAAARAKGPAPDGAMCSTQAALLKTPW